MCSVIHLTNVLLNLCLRNIKLKIHLYYLNAKAEVKTLVEIATVVLVILCRLLDA